MASINLSGILKDPSGEVAVGDQIRFTHRTTTGDTIKFARSVLIIPPGGAYDIDLEFGNIFVEYLDVKDVNYKNLGVVTVNIDSTATSLPELLNAIDPPTDEQLLEFQSILADTVIAKDLAEAAAASVQVKTFLTLDAWKASGTALAGDEATTTERTAGFGGGATGDVISGIGTVNGKDRVQHGTLSLTWVLRKNIPLSPIMYGYDLDAANMTSIAIVDANWVIMKFFLDDIKNNALQSIEFNTILTLRKIHANWISGTDTPLGFYSDSTTDGTKTTGHTPSTSSDAAPFSVTVNESPNAYPKVLEGLVDNMGPAKTVTTIYNGGFDAESYRSGFGLQHWYNVWFRGLAGSNVDFSDVKAIVLGFGTSDSANVDDTASVIANYGPDLECNIVDCFLRGVQPILQTPVATTQHFGNTLDARNGDQTLTIINAVQDELKKKYSLEQLTYGEPQIKALDGFRSLHYGDIISPSPTDQVHTVDLGHRLHAGYIMKEMNDQVVRVNDKAVNMFAGSTHYRVENEATNITTDVLTRAITEQGAAVERIGEYFYKFPASASDEKMLELDIYCEKPTTLFYMPIDSSVEQPSFLINHFTYDDNQTITSQALFTQPVAKTFSKLYQIANLTYGLNRVFIKANSAGGQQLIGGMMAVPHLLMGDFTFYRETPGGTNRIMRNFKFRDNNQDSAPAQALNSLHDSWMQYMPLDNAFMSIGFVLNKTLAAATDFEIFSHFNDHLLKGTSHNIFTINDDTLTVDKVVNGVTTQVGTVNTGGVGAAMVAGASVMIRIRTRFFSPDTTQVQLHVNGVQLTSVTVAIGDLWTSGYGLEMNTIQCHSVSVNSIETLKGDNQNII